MPPCENRRCFVVLHLSPEHESLLPEILNSAGLLAAKHARNGETILPNRISHDERARSAQTQARTVRDA